MASPRSKPTHEEDVVIPEEHANVKEIKSEAIKAEENHKAEIKKAETENEFLQQDKLAHDEHEHLLAETFQQAEKRYRDARDELEGCYFENKHNKKYNTTLVKQARCVRDVADKEFDKTQATDSVKMGALADALECCVEGIKNPDNIENFNRVSNLAAHAETQASVGKKVAAGLILFVGILSVLAFGALVMATHGVALAALPVIGPAVTAGLACMGAAATALGVSASILTFTGLGIGAAATVGGTALAISGQARGLASSMHSFHNKLTNFHEAEKAAKLDYMNESERTSLMVQ